MRDFYTLLNCDISAPVEQLKQAYFQLLRQFHPDKSRTTSAAEIDPFLDLVRAWKVLGNPSTRTNYNIWLCEQQLRSDKELIFDDIWLNCGETATHSVDDYFEENCRCGGIYQVPSEAVEQLVLDYLLVDCSNCSLTLRVWRSSSCKQQQ